jgi:hypothetical protein
MKTPKKGKVYNSADLGERAIHRHHLTYFCFSTGGGVHEPSVTATFGQ